MTPLWGCWGQEVIFEVAEAKFCFSSSFYEFSSIIIRPQRPQKRLCQIFQKLHEISRFLPRINMTYIFTLYNMLDVSKLYNYIPTFWTVKNVLLLSSLLDNQCSIVGICIWILRRKNCSIWVTRIFCLNVMMMHYIS